MKHRRIAKSAFFNLAARICLALACTMSISAYANIITVTNTNESGPGSLRQAFAIANDGDKITFVVTGSIGLDVALWTRAIRAANNKREIPDIWALIRDVRAAQRRSLGRRAVLDAATAAELIIDNQLRAGLSRTNPKAFVDRLMRNTWQVSRRLELMDSLGLWLPQNIEANLTSLRNRVLHDNARVTRAEAKAAVEPAEQLAPQYEQALVK